MMNKELELLKRKFERERLARLEAEKLLEEKSLELYYSNQKLKLLNSNLEDSIKIKSKKLDETENEYHILVESINDLIIKTDLKGNIIYSNQIAGKILDSDKPGLLGRRIFDFIPVEKRKQIIYFFCRQFLNRKCINYIELELNVEPGKIRWFGINVQFSDGRCRSCEKKLFFKINNKNTFNASDACHYENVIVVAHDITDQKLAIVELEKSEKRYRELTEFLPELICEVDTNGKLTYVNQFALDKFGYTNDEIWKTSFDFLNIFDVQDRPQVVANMQKLLAAGGQLSNEYFALKKNGEKFPVIVYSTPIFNQDAIAGIRGVMVDITERKKNELEIARNLRQQEILSNISLNYNSLQDFDEKTIEALRIIGEHTQVSRVYIFEDSADGLFTNNTYEWCNNGIVAQIDDLQNIPYSMIPSWKTMLLENGIIYSENISELSQDLRDILEPQEIQSIVVLPLKLDGKYFGFIGFDECTNRRGWSKSEIELLRTISNILSNAYLRNIINNELIYSVTENKGIINSIPDQIIRISGSGKILSLLSPRKHGLFAGYKEGENDTIETLLEQDLGTSFLASVKECLSEGSFKFDFTHLNWDNLEYYEARFVKLKKNEVLAIIRDVTEAKEKEKELQIAKNNAEEASRAKSEFLANISHEIRTPMNAILGFSEWLHDNIADPQHKSYLHTILTSGRNLLALINDILDLSKIESGKLRIEMEPMRCDVLVNEIKQVLKHKFEVKNLVFNVIIDQTVPEYIYMDEIRFYQILFNVIDNAIKFTAKGYINVSIYTTNTTSDDLINLIVSIEDTGIGIKEDQQEKIFTAFTQQSGQSNRYFEGTGLGLAIVGGLLKKLDGEIKIKSKIGRGSTFTITFKDVKIAEITEKSVKAVENQYNIILEPCNIMIVDDVDFNIRVLRRIIGSENVTFIEATSGEQALDILHSEKPDIIFMDIRMPGINGYDVTEIIKNEERHKNTPVIAFTASTMNDDMDRIEVVFDAFLQKPVFKKDVMIVLKKYLPYRYKHIEKQEVEYIPEAMSLVSAENLPEVIHSLENQFQQEWESIKNDLIIFDIENFNNRLSDFASNNYCGILDQYCRELNQGLQTFDIEMIENKLTEFPAIISKLKSMNNAD